MKCKYKQILNKNTNAYIIYSSTMFFNYKLVLVVIIDYVFRTQLVHHVHTDLIDIWELRDDITE